MSSGTFYAFAGVGLLSLGLFGAIAADDRIRRVLAVNVMGTGVFMVLIALAAPPPAGSTDPVLHAMVLTGIVVAVSATGVAVALACRLEEAEDEPSTDAEVPSEDRTR